MAGMANEIEAFLGSHPSLLPKKAAAGRSEQCYPIRLPILPSGRTFSSSELVLPKGFPQELAFVRLSADAVLSVPHVDSEGLLCFAGEIGTGSGASITERLDDLLARFFSEFLEPWAAGKLDGAFANEPHNYWMIHVNRCASRDGPIHRVYTTELRSSEPSIYSGLLLHPGRILIAGRDSQLRARFIKAFTHRAKPQENVIIADIPIDVDLTPMTWPQNQREIDKLLAFRLDVADLSKFQSKQRLREHRLVLLRGPRCSYGFLLAGGPPTIVQQGKNKKERRFIDPVPLKVERIDPMWTYGRDQHPIVGSRQKQHVLVFGAGALGGGVLEEIARAGVGRISIIDPDIYSAANIGRNRLGAQSLGLAKAVEITAHIGSANPACHVTAYPTSAAVWIDKYGMEEVDLILDLTGEPEVRAQLDLSRSKTPLPIVIGWMEPYVVAAHACLLPPVSPWMGGPIDRMETLQAISWPEDVIQQEPGCSSRFQSYTSVASTYAIGVVANAVLDLLDGKINAAVVRSWIRGRQFLDANYPGLQHREWAAAAVPFDGILMERPFDE